MKGTSIFNFRPWSKINPPLPRTPRESQQLLSALTSSFRRQLDHEYPPSHTSSPSSSRPGRNGDRPMVANTNSSAHATDSHLKAILENPLFRVVPSKSAVARDQSGAEGQNLMEEPMSVFDDLVASGSVTSTNLCDCLKSQLLLASTQAGDRVSEAIKDSKAGSKVVSWWFASDSEARKMLLMSRASTATLLKFMVAEGLQDTVMVWLDMLLKQDIGGNNGQLPKQLAQQIFGSLLVDLINAEAQYGRGLGSAMAYYIQTCKTHLSTPDQMADQSKKAMLLHGGARLGRLMMQQEGTKEVPAALYEQFMGLVTTFTPKSMLSASVPIYHPTRPDIEPFLKFMDSLPPGRPESWAKPKREVFTRAAFDALRVSIDQEEFGDASYLAGYLQQLLPGKDHASPEEEFLLNRLDLTLT
ncbi:hypothetical protein ASPWEDRAFT_368014 [Aspergillus wentii DTO 134E9]|uniref:Uncharacterized protein n=1 Tax=Aspergillus wentii DTO 134E9 TaxID=1073089 RepID=A0A1L9RWS3_ASPWE|nr:uncharacterized protein ASPWEDRAFT_368014 [Aspergillus wentii DTO 134E9]KAI9929004.1 Saccharopine dehydrogenase [Aspergillus wentii]OJJ39307.1 hypothetical protein ASPWEDRAFT_368014 [Aspergillus wentii DTO 134E9]